jgi:lipopolysaccharide/colanic/teichoic acid biosynthesis glycosyltransferase
MEIIVSTKSLVEAVFEDSDSELSTERYISGDEYVFEKQIPPRKPRFNSPPSISLVQEQTISWSQSGTKRLFDFLCVLLVLPLLVPIYLVIALAVRLTSSGPVLFLQKRVGRHGKLFTILKFRTMTHSKDTAHHAVTTTENQPFTPVGPFLRRYKLDELPQLLNVLMGEMSLVGARPKLPEHQTVDLLYRPGITGAATFAFAAKRKYSLAFRSILWTRIITPSFFLQRAASTMSTWHTLLFAPTSSSSSIAYCAAGMIPWWTACPNPMSSARTAECAARMC